MKEMDGRGRGERDVHPIFCSMPAVMSSLGLTGLHSFHQAQPSPSSRSSAQPSTAEHRRGQASSGIAPRRAQGTSNSGLVGHYSMVSSGHVELRPLWAQLLHRAQAPPPSPAPSSGLAKLYSLRRAPTSPSSGTSAAQPSSSTHLLLAEHNIHH
ncbi:hypothetical protein Dimus_011728 [Dionaea muscipula]